MTAYKRRRGFTLIELIIVVTIIGILSSITLASLNSARKKGRDTARIQAMKQIQNALQLYWNTNGSFPAVSGSAGTVLTGILTPVYIKSIPVEPLGGTNDYQYRALTSLTTGGVCSSNCQSYHLGVSLEQGANSKVLIGDEDGEDVVNTPTSGSTIDGLSTLANCASQVGITQTTDLCYDITP